MATKYALVEVWVAVDENGDYVAHHDPAELSQAYEDAVRPVAEAEGMRRVKLTVKVPLPEVIELTGEVAVEEDAGELKVA